MGMREYPHSAPHSGTLAGMIPPGHDLRAASRELAGVTTPKGWTAVTLNRTHKWLYSDGRYCMPVLTNLSVLFKLMRRYREDFSYRLRFMPWS